VNTFISKLFFFKDAMKEKNKICHAHSLIIKVTGQLNGFINEGK
jgi:hypothetical protein